MREEKSFKNRSEYSGIQVVQWNVKAEITYKGSLESFQVTLWKNMMLELPLKFTARSYKMESILLFFFLRALFSF